MIRMSLIHLSKPCARPAALTTPNWSPAKPSIVTATTADSPSCATNCSRASGIIGCFSKPRAVAADESAIVPFRCLDFDEGFKCRQSHAKLRRAVGHSRFVAAA